ncbi:MAG: hypothetical protein QGD91_11865 [Actinomycetota bacterium]|nr:hypothetical protein [Actinomycetota bacterium]
MFQQAVEIEPIITDRDTAAVDNAVDAESEVIFLAEGVVALDKMPEKTASHVAQSDQGQPDSLHLGLTFGNGFMDHCLVVRSIPTE